MQPLNSTVCVHELPLNVLSTVLHTLLLGTLVHCTVKAILRILGIAHWLKRTDKNFYQKYTALYSTMTGTYDNIKAVRLIWF